MSIATFRLAVRQLRSDKPVEVPGRWYKTQKEHWLGWLGQYHGPGAYARKRGPRRNAEYAYNHIVESKMLLWLITAAGVSRLLVAAAMRAEQRARSMQAKSAAVRKHVPWELVEARLRARLRRAKAAA